MPRRVGWLVLTGRDMFKTAIRREIIEEIAAIPAASCAVAQSEPKEPEADCLTGERSFGQGRRATEFSAAFR